MPEPVTPTPSPEVADVREGVWLISRIACADPAALAELYKAWGDRLFSMALHWLGDQGAAQEALQDCFLRIWNRAGDYSQDRGKPFAWCAMILRGLCLDRLRRRHRRIVTAGDFMSMDYLAVPDDPHGVKDLYFQETIARVRDALDQLDSHESESVQAALFDPRTIAEHAERWGIPSGSAKTRIHRAMAKLRAILNTHDLS
jgi:RNA polymerase sigma-70 factor (ECF subfamily)